MMLLHHLKQSLIRLLLLRVIFLTKTKYSPKPINHKTKFTFRQKNPNTKSRLCKDKTLLKASLVDYISFLIPDPAQTRPLTNS